MQLSIGHKILATVFLTTTLLVGLTVGLVRLSLGRGFTNYVNQVELERLQPLVHGLEQEYQQKGRWEIGSDLPAWLRQHQPPRPDPADGTHPPPDPLGVAPRLALVGADGRLVAGNPMAVSSPDRRPIVVSGQVVGNLALLPLVGVTDGLSGQFLREQSRNLLGVAVVGVLLSAVTATLLARHLRSRILLLSEGTKELAAGDYQVRIPIDSEDELSELAVSFNQMAATLGRSEESRKQWVADVSHELRTPLAVLRAEIEALQDGVRQPNSEALQLLLDQVLTLGKLTDDLFQLARSDLGQLQYRMEEVDLWLLLERTIEPFRSRYEKAGIRVELVRQSSRLKSSVWGDPARLGQMFVNFLENSLRYTDRGGRLEVRCQSLGSNWIVSFDDSPPGVPSDQLGKLFDRFHRVEGSRNKELGGSGLGLAICRNIAVAHQGELSAGPSKLGGLKLELKLACYPK